MKKMISASIALFVMEEPQVGPTVVTLILSSGVVAFGAVVVDVVVEVAAAAPAWAEVVVVGAAVVDVVVLDVLDVLDVDGGRRVRRGHLQQRLLDVVVDRLLLAGRQVVQVRLHVEGLLVPAAEQLHRRVDQPGVGQRIGRLGLADARRQRSSTRSRP